MVGALCEGMLLYLWFYTFENSENQRLAQFHRLLNRSKHDRASLDDNLKQNMLETTGISHHITL